MAPSDARKEYILSATANYFGLSPTDAAVADLATSKQLDNFLDDGDTMLLSASVVRSGEGDTSKVDKIHLDNSTVVGHTRDDKVLVFFKVRPDVVTPANLHRDVLVSSMLDSPVSALYHALQKVYSPLLLKDRKWSNEFDPKLQALVTELEKGLGSVVRRSGGGGGDSGGKDDEDSSSSSDALSAILTPMDETQYWADVANSAKKREERERASAFWTALEPVAKEFSGLSNVALSDAEDALETSGNCLDDLWKLEGSHSFPQRRMVHLMDVISHAITRFIQTKCSALDLWRAPYSQVRNGLLNVPCLARLIEKSFSTFTFPYFNLKLFIYFSFDN